jgi:hypothetical protein
VNIKIFTWILTKEQVVDFKKGIGYRDENTSDGRDMGCIEDEC